jgi:hypothetical protein
MPYFGIYNSILHTPLGGANKWLRGLTFETTPEPEPVKTGVGTSEL